MRNLHQFLSLGILSVLTVTAVAAPMPHMIVVEDAGVVPIVKTQIIRRVNGQEPVRTVEATIFEVTNGGKDIVAREVTMQDNEKQFSDKQMSNPVIKRGGVIVPTSKIELNKTLKQNGEIISEQKSIDAEGVEFKKGQEMVKRTLLLNQGKNPETGAKLSHAVMTENGVVTRDVTVLDEND